MSEQHAVAKDPRKDLEEHLRKALPTLEAVAGQHFNPERMLKVVLLAATKNPGILKCSKESVVQAVMQATEMGLEVGSAFGHAYLVPFKGACTLVVGYQGLIECALRTPSVLDIRAVPVFKGEPFVYREGLHPVVEHTPNLDGDRVYKNLVATYAVATLAGGVQKVEVMGLKDIEAVRARSQSAKSDYSPWKNDRDAVEMAKKSPVRRMAKYLPKSRELAQAIATDEHDDGILDGVLVGGAEVQTATESAKDRLRKRVPTAEGAEAPAGEKPLTDAEQLAEDARIAEMDERRERKGK